MGVYREGGGGCTTSDHTVMTGKQFIDQDEPFSVISSLHLKTAHAVHRLSVV